MKQLLLYFLFFVGSAIILVQCAKFFPTTNKTLKHRSLSRTTINIAAFSKQTNTAITGTNTPTFKFSFKNKIVDPFFYNKGLPYNMMMFIDNHALFYNPYIGLNYYGLVRKYKGKSQRNK